MTFVEYFVENRNKLVANGSITAIGFFAALYVNGLVEDCKDRHSFINTLNALKVEAKSNEAILRESFEPMFRKDLVLRKFSTTLISHALSDPSFVKNASTEQITTLVQYQRTITLANAYRAKAESIRFSDGYFKDTKGQTIRSWEPSLVTAWEGNLHECQTTIQNVNALQ